MLMETSTVVEFTAIGKLDIGPDSYLHPRLPRLLRHDQRLLAAPNPIQAPILAKILCQQSP